MPASSMNDRALSFDQRGGAIPLTGSWSSFGALQKKSGNMWWCTLTVWVIGGSWSGGGENQTGGLVGDHLRGGVGRAGRNARHDGGIGDPEPLEAVDT